MGDEIGPKFNLPSKKYGLIIPGKTTAIKPTKVVKPCIFDEDEDDNDELDAKTITKTRVNTSDTRIKRQTQINIEKALKEDPNAFEYDQIYDKLAEEKAKLDPKTKNKSQEPKYIVGLMKAAATRQIEYERRQDRKIQREREAEGDIFKDKESFVTEAYRKRMEERQRIEEEERNQEKIEELFDVRKQRDLKGFYDSMLKMRTGELVIEEESEKQKRIEREEREREERLKKEQEFMKKNMSKKNIRSRVEKEDSSEEEIEQSTNEPQVEQYESQNKDSTELKENIVENEREEPEAKKAKVDEISDKDNEIEKEEPTVEEKPKKPETKEERWARLFTKRHVKELFDKEVADYFRRKNEILSQKMYIERD